MAEEPFGPLPRFWWLVIGSIAFDERYVFAVVFYCRDGLFVLTIGDDRDGLGPVDVGTIDVIAGNRGARIAAALGVRPPILTNEFVQEAAGLGRGQVGLPSSGEIGAIAKYVPGIVVDQDVARHFHLQPQSPEARLWSIHASNNTRNARMRQALFPHGFTNTPKFMLPDNGGLYEDEEYTDVSVDVLRLPYPICALEYASDDKLYDPDGGLERCDKHISIAFDPKRLPPPLKAEFFRTLDRNELDAIPNNSIAIIALYAFNESKSAIRGSEWAYASGVVFLDADKPFLPSMPTRLVDARACFFVENFNSEVRNGKPPYLVKMAFKGNTQDDVKTTLHFATAMSCSNVSTEKLTPPPLVNKKRLSKGKAPLFEYHVLNLDVVREYSHDQFA